MLTSLSTFTFFIFDVLISFFITHHVKEVGIKNMKICGRIALTFFEIDCFKSL